MSGIETRPAHEKADEFMVELNNILDGTDENETSPALTTAISTDVLPQPLQPNAWATVILKNAFPDFKH